jgi:hypothetical protein
MGILVAHISDFVKEKSGSYSVRRWSAQPCGHAKGCFTVMAALDAAIHAFRRREGPQGSLRGQKAFSQPIVTINGNAETRL